MRVERGHEDFAVRSLSVRSPWAGLIESGAKTLEIRSRRTHFRGELLICQSGGGGAVAIVEVVGCRAFTEADDEASGGVWSQIEKSRSNHWAWELRLIRRVTSDQIKGRLGFYDVPIAALRSAGPL